MFFRGVFFSNEACRGKRGQAIRAKSPTHVDQRLHRADTANSTAPSRYSTTKLNKNLLYHPHHQRKLHALNHNNNNNKHATKQKQTKKTRKTAPVFGS